MQITPYIRRAQYHETDAMGVIHHANYIRWFEEARVDFMEKMDFGYGRAVEANIDFAVLGISCEYKGMVRFGETVEIACSIAEITPSRMQVLYQVRDAATGELRTTGESRHCYFHSQRQKPVSLKKELPLLYERFRELCVADSQKGNTRRK